MLTSLLCLKELEKQNIKKRKGNQASGRWRDDEKRCENKREVVWKTNRKEDETKVNKEDDKNNDRKNR